MPKSAPEPINDLDVFLLRWAEEWMDDAVQNRRVGELPYCTRALEHLHSQRDGRQWPVVIDITSRRRAGQAVSKDPIAA